MTKHFDTGIGRCPACGLNNLHQKSTEVHFREEDAKEGVNVKVSLAGVERADPRGNPSERRDGIRIRFECEGCLGEPELVLAQNKGVTDIYWDSWRTVQLASMRTDSDS